MVLHRMARSGGGTMAAPGALPRWLGPASRLNLLVLRLGMRIGTQHILSVPGRKTGRMRSTPVSLVTLDGVRYVVSGEGLSWVKNAPTAGWAEPVSYTHLRAH